MVKDTKRDIAKLGVASCLSVASDANAQYIRIHKAIVKHFTEGVAEHTHANCS